MSCCVQQRVYIVCTDRVTDASQALFALQLLSRVAGVATRTNRDSVLFPTEGVIMVYCVT